jgi:formylglycine-generating enzyme required for sulfatase activity
MKLSTVLCVVAVSLSPAIINFASAQPASLRLISETPHEFFGSGDFDGDGRDDLVIVDKETGKYRLGYQLTTGVFTWEDCRPSGISGVTGFTIGKLLATNLDALAFTSPDAAQIVFIPASSPTEPSPPVTVPFTAAIGPNTIVATEVGGAGKTSLQDLFVASIYNSPDPNQATWIRNDGAQFPKIAEVTLAGPASKGNRLKLSATPSEVVSMIITSDKGETLQLDSASGDKPTTLAKLPDLPTGSEYTVLKTSASELPFFVTYKSGENTLTIWHLDQGAGQRTIAKVNPVDAGQPVRRVISLNAANPKLLVIFGDGEKAGIFNFDGSKAALAQTITGTNEFFSSALDVPDGFIAFLEPPKGKVSVRYHLYKTSGPNYAFSAFGTLPTLADNDNITIPEIHKRIVANSTIKTEAEMKPYTNTIPGTEVNYALVPIPGGEFTMGTPDNEPDRKSDEGPQHKVKISPFWMGKYEVTWNEYELFMYPEEEKTVRATSHNGDPAADKLSDAVTHPSKPYTEMSFGMGKDGFPAISMTQHAANKYCQWLSAKTGHFYRLPTEAEWEYACRAGTTTTFFFGTDTNKLSEYAWFEQNSDFKYQKVGKKKPNPWGLYDIYGNVVEWVLDQYDPDYYKQCASQGEIVDPWNKATKPYPHSVRGGSWDDELKMCRSGARRGSDRSWKMQDPQLPKSVWYHSDAQWVGFRIVRPLKIPSAEEMQKYWTSNVEKD